ncbi:MAG: UDP-N-acetylglucosamine--N-acetylmuramyl-(pentapeptide) pyrophosphoryl-undecaprenol N-acetylglucosamine transferase, partial [Ignavibacteria bacterium]
FSSAILGAKVILIEQNSFPGVTTRILEKYADEIHISFDDSRKYFKNKEKVFFTGNPIRQKLSSIQKEDALRKFGFISGKKTLLILGGSLGAASLNDAAAASVKKLQGSGLQIIWQTGNLYYKKYESLTSPGIWINSFIDEMNFAYSAADLLLARSGATTIAELLALGIPSILVPSPNVAGNHQYFNAKSLSDKNAAVLIEDKYIKEKFFDSVNDLIFNDSKLFELSKNARALAKPDAAQIIAANAINLAGKK